MVMRPCIDCGSLIPSGPRCRRCRLARERVRNRDPKRAAYRDPVYRSIPLGGICWICGKPGADTRDHVVPVSKGGTVRDGIRPAHRSCNSARGNRS